MFKTSVEVHEYYLTKSREVSKDAGRVLKTDLDNEANDKLRGGIAGNISGEVYAIEYDINVFQKATKDGIHATMGDIRSLPYLDDYFDVILDLSTIDHISPEDLDTTFKGYARVLKTGGKLLMFFWSGTNEEGGTWKPSNQYYFDRKDFVDRLGKYFTITENEAVYQLGANTLIQILGEKK